MSVKAVRHGNFSIERLYAARPQALFAAWTEPDLKSRWFAGPENWFLIRRDIDVRIGGHETLHGSYEEGAETIFKARYHDVVRNELLVYTYDMFIDQEHCSVSLASAEISPEGRGARLVYTEQAAFLDEADTLAARERLAIFHLDRLGNLLKPPGHR